MSSHYTAANLARVWPANPEIVTNRSAPSMDSGTHGPFGPNAASPAAEVRKLARREELEKHEPVRDGGVNEYNERHGNHEFYLHHS